MFERNIVQAPLILITYGFSKRLFSYEQDGIHKLPIFSDPIIASVFLKSINVSMDALLEGEEDLQIQICDDTTHASDLFKMISLINPNIIVVFNAPPLIEEMKIQIENAGSCLIGSREYSLDELQESIIDA